MKKKHLLLLLPFVLLMNCKKNSSSGANFKCYVNGSLVEGTAATSYASAGQAFEIVMANTNVESVSLVWYQIAAYDSAGKLVPGGYPIVANQVPLKVAGVYKSPGGTNTYTTNFTNGLITISSNSGPGGKISGSFYFNAQNITGSGDSVVITQGTFTDVPVTD
jgi:hypothetical protein